MASDGVTLEARDGVVVVSLAGEFDLVQAEAVRVSLRAAMVESPPRVVVDLSGATFMDSTVLGVLAGARKATGQRSGWLRLVCAENPLVHKVLEITQFDVAFGLYDDVDDAIKGPA